MSRIGMLVALLAVAAGCSAPRVQPAATSTSQVAATSTTTTITTTTTIPPEPEPTVEYIPMVIEIPSYDVVEISYGSTQFIYDTATHNRYFNTPDGLVVFIYDSNVWLVPTIAVARDIAADNVALSAIAEHELSGISHVSTGDISQWFTVSQFPSGVIEVTAGWPAAEIPDIPAFTPVDPVMEVVEAFNSTRPFSDAEQRVFDAATLIAETVNMPAESVTADGVERTADQLFADGALSDVRLVTRWDRTYVSAYDQLGRQRTAHVCVIGATATISWNFC